MDSTPKVKQFIVDEFMPDVPVEELDSDYDLIAGGVVDSLGLLKVVAWMETEFDVEVDESELGPDSFRTPAAIGAFIDQSGETPFECRLARQAPARRRAGPTPSCSRI